MITDWKTTITSVVTGIVTILASFNIIIPDTWVTIIISVGVVLLGIFAKDSKQVTNDKQ